MITFFRVKLVVVAVLLVVLATLSCFRRSQVVSEELKTDLPDIIRRGKIVAVTSFNSSSYFVQNGNQKGYQMELMKQLAANLDVELEVIVVPDVEKAFRMLNDRKCDIIAMSLEPTPERTQFFNFTDPHIETRKVLVQLRKSRVNESYIDSISELAGKQISVTKKSAFKSMLQPLFSEFSDSVVVNEINKEQEALIRDVSRGHIKYAIVDEYIASANANLLKNIDFSLQVGEPHKLAWVVRKHSEELLSEVNIWLGSFIETTQYKSIYYRYFVSNLMYKAIYTSNGSISPYDELIKKYSREIGWDWRLLAALIYKESRFNHNVVSHKGAYGLMQLVPETGATFGAGADAEPEQNIRAGVKLISWLDRRLASSVPDPNERIKFVLASYNAGLGHIRDAQNLADKFGKQSSVWEENVEFCLALKANPEYYNNPVVRLGKLNGERVNEYVDDVLDKYNMYLYKTEK